MIAGSVLALARVALALAVMPAQGRQPLDLSRLLSRIEPAFVVVGGGSGALISADGLIVTNYHVAGARPDWQVIIAGRAVAARLLGIDPRGDLALLQAEGDGPYAFLELSDSDALALGQRVVALGNPFGLTLDGRPAASLGVIGALHRYQGGYSDAIQTDAAINPGNSGGPLVDLEGRLVGVNGRVAVRFGDRLNTGVGFAIPANQVRRFLPILRRGERARHAQLAGVQLGDDPGGEGALILRLDPDSTAARAGLKRGEAIVSLDGLRITHALRLQGLVGAYPADMTVRLGLRDPEDRLREVELTLDGRSEGRAEDTSAARAYLGIRYAEDAPAGGGVEVEEVLPGTAAEDAGLESGDVIRQMDGQEVASVGELVRLLAERQPGDRVTLAVRRGGQELTLIAVLRSR